MDRLTWQDVADMAEGWAQHPPVQWMVQAYLGIKADNDEKPPSEADCTAFLATMAAKAKP